MLDYKKIKKPLKFRIAAIFSVIMMAASFVGDLPLSAFIAEAADLQTDEDTDDTGEYLNINEDETPSIIIENDARSEVIASYIPLSEDEETSLYERTFKRSLTGVLKTSANSGFVPIDQTDIVDNALKQFKLEYVYTSPEPYEDDTANYMERENNFVIKARLTINTEHSIDAGNMEFRLPGTLFSNRDGGYCRIKAVAVSKFKSIPNKSDNDDQVYDPNSVSVNHEDSVAPFNYYIDPETGDYVFVNYDTLHSSSNMIEISFEKVEVFDVRDETTWNIEPQTHIIYNMEEEGTLNDQTDRFIHYKYTEDGNEIDLYQLMKSQSSGEKIFVYYDETGRPKYIDSVENGAHIWRKIKDDAVVGIETTVEELVNSYSDSYDMPSGKEPQAVTNPYSLDKTGPGISGKINTEVNLKSITKTPAADTGKGYGAQLYTLGQMSRYIDTSNPAMQAVLENGKLSDEYVYTCWSVNTKGTCTQPWSLLFEEQPLKANLVKVSEAGTMNIGSERFIDKEGVEWAYEVDENGDIKYTAVNGAKVLGVTTIRPNGSFHYDSEIKSGSSDISKMYNYVSADILSEDNPNGYGDFWYAADSNAEMRNTFGLSDVANDKKFNVGYYVVVAYPKDDIDSYVADEYGADVTHYAQLSNKVVAHLYSRDERQEQVSNRATDLPIMLSDYNWKGGGDSWYSNKYVEGDDKEGVLTVIDELKKTTDSQQYLGNIVFHESYSAGYYNTCHKTKDDYSYESGKYYQIVNVDDVMTAMPYGYLTENETLKEVYGKPFILGGDDYFYSRAVLTISEQDIDPFEDENLKLTGSIADEYKAVDADLRNKNVENGLDWVVYGWFDGESNWREINMSQYRTNAVKEKLSAVDADNPHITMNEYIACMDKDGKYKLTMNFLDKDGESGCPFRVKIVHNSIAYDSDATFVLTTQLKVTSPKLDATSRHSNLFYDDGQALSDNHPSLDSFRINLKNYSANTVTAYDTNNNTSAKKINIWYDGTADGKASSYRNYESNPYWSFVNANRYDFLTREEMKKLYSSMQGSGNNYWHVTEADREKTALGEELLDNGTLPSPYGDSEYLPFDYIAPELSGKIYSSLEEFRDDNCHIIRNIASIDVSELEKNSKAGKFASWENDTRKGQVLMTYTLYGYEGYKLSKELEPIITETHADDQPMRQTVIFSDLLPAGVNYHGSSVPVCGKLTTTNIGRTGYPINEDDVNTFAETWNNTQARIIDTKTESNWKNTGRTLVQFTVEYEDDHTNGILNSNSWYIGCGIQFKAYVSWDNYTSAAEKDNIFAFVAADDYNEGDIYGKWTGDGESQVYDDKGTVVPKTYSNDPSMDYTPFKNKSDLDNDNTDSEHNRMYGHANEMDTITMARTLGIKKSVKADADLYSDYENKDSVIAGKGYTYKIHIDKTEQGIASDLVVFDKIEAVTPSTWKGTFQGVDLNEVKSEYPEAEPDIWYSESLNAPTELYRIPKNDNPQSDEDYIYTFDKTETYDSGDKTYEAEPTQWDFTKVNEMIGDETEEITINGTTKTVSKRWIKSTDWTKNNAEVHSVAVDFGNTLVLQGQNAVVNVYIKMTAPSYDEKYKYTFNRSSFCFQDYHRNGDNIEPSGTFEYSGSNITTVTIGQRRRVEVCKKIPLEASVNKEILEQAEFTFQVKKREYVAGAADKDNPDKVTQINEGDYNCANIAYDLYKLDDNGTTWHKVDKGIIHTTDDNGEFKLRYGYKAVFDEISAYAPYLIKKVGDEYVYELDENNEKIPINKYDFENYTVIEKSVPYWLGVKNLVSEDEDFNGDGVISDEESDARKEITVENFYRPVVYITKNPKGVPEGTTVDKTFTYKLRIFKLTDPKLGDADGNRTQLTKAELEHDYTILNKTISASSNNAFTDVREDGKLYWYKVDGSAGLYECPPGWNQENDQENLYQEWNETTQKYDVKCSEVKEDVNGAYYEVKFNTDITNTVALPVYIKHEENGSEVGMLYQEGETTYPRYSFEITEVNPEGSDWFCDNLDYGGTFGAGENAFDWVNTYKYKELILTKNVTHAPDDLSNTSFMFKLTDANGNPYTRYKSGNDGKVTWTLCTMDSTGNITEPAEKNATNSGTIGDDGTFTVKGCGNDADKTGDKKVVKLSYVSLGNSGSAAKYSITEILPERENETPVNTATTTEYLAVKDSDTVQVKQNIPYSNLTIENDYLKRDITVKKVVASSSSPGDREFEMVLCPKKLTAQPSASITGLKNDGTSITATAVSNPADGWKFNLKDGESVTFKEIGVVGEKFDLYEKYDSNFKLLTQEDPNDNGTYRKVTTLTLNSSSDSSTDVVNGTEGYIVLRKKYTGDTAAFGETLRNENPVTFDLKLKNNNGVYDTVSNLTDEEVKIINGSTFDKTEDMTIKEGETCVVNLKALSQKLTGKNELCDFEIVEKDWKKSAQIEGSWYIIEPENTDAVWQFDSDTKQAVFTNVVTNYSAENAIYKRIGYKDKEAVKPGGVITFRVTDKSGTPVGNVRCTAISHDGELLGYSARSDENGLIRIDFADTAFAGNTGWKTDEGVRQYFLKLYFDRAVKINATADDTLCITEVGTETDKTWGTLIGYEKYGDSDTTITGAHLSDESFDRWCSDADTFVNTQETEPITVQKVVNASGEELSEEDTSAEFSYTVAQLIDGNAEPAPHISYKVYDISDNAMTSPKRTGTTDDTETGIFTLHHGEKVVLELSKNAQWRITEDNSGSYKLVTDAADVIKHDTIEGDEDHALYGDAGDDADEAIAHKNASSGYAYAEYVPDNTQPDKKVTLYIVEDTSTEDPAPYKCYYINDAGISVDVTDKVGTNQSNYPANATIRDKFIADFEIADVDNVKEYFPTTIRELTYGFELNTTHDVENEKIPENLPYSVVLVNGLGKGTKSGDGKAQAQPMFAKYDTDHDSFDDVTPRTHLKKDDQNDNYYYWGNSSTEWKNRYYDASKYDANLTYRQGKSLLLGNRDSEDDDVNDIIAIYSDVTHTNRIWDYYNGTATRSGNIVLPESIYVYHGNIKTDLTNLLAGNFDETKFDTNPHRIVGIGTGAYIGSFNFGSITISKYVKKIGDNAFNGRDQLKDVIWDGDNYPYDPDCGVSVIGAWAFAGTKVDVVLPKSVETIERGAFKTYKGTGGARNASSHSIVLPSKLHFLAEAADSRLGETANYTNNVTLKVGSGSNIEDMITKFNTITDGNGKPDNTFGLREVPYNPYTVIFGQNTSAAGLTIDISVINLFDRHQGNGNANMEYGRTIVFPKGKLTLAKECLKQGGAISSQNFLRVFLTDKTSDLTVLGTMTNYNNHNQYILFPNLTRSAAEASAGWLTNINYLTLNGSNLVHVIYQDELATELTNIISAVGESYIDDEVEALLYSKAGLTYPTPTPLPAPPRPQNNSMNISQLLYLERKKLMIVTR